MTITGGGTLPSWRMHGLPDITADQARAAMGIDWMPRRLLSQAIPPAYTEWIGAQLLNVIAAQPSRRPLVTRGA